jgi:chromosome segregation ATPase
LSRLDKAQKDYDSMVMNNNQLAGENVQKLAELKSKDEDIAALRKELAKVSKIRDALQRKWKQTEDQKMESEQKRESLRQQILGMEREIEANKKQAEAHHKEIDDLKRERDALNKV